MVGGIKVRITLQENTNFPVYWIDEFNMTKKKVQKIEFYG
jgi:hypothetical protein